MITWIALALALVALLMLLQRGRRMAKLSEEIGSLRYLEVRVRDVRKELDAAIAETRRHLAAVNEGKKLPADLILEGRSLDAHADEEGILGAIREAIEKNRIAIFMKGTPEAPQCGFSASVVDVFSEMNVPFVGVNAVAHPKFRAVLQKFSGWPTLPQVFVSGKLVGGADIVKEMKASGDLETLVQEALAAPAAAPPSA